MGVTTRPPRRARRKPQDVVLSMGDASTFATALEWLVRRGGAQHKASHAIHEWPRVDCGVAQESVLWCVRAPFFEVPSLVYFSGAVTICNTSEVTEGS